MPNLENLLTYPPAQFDVVRHTLTLGYACHLAGLVYFAVTLKQSAPRYRTSGVLSMVVMVSAALILYQQADDWGRTFHYDGGRFVRVPDQLFSNGFRYLNWLIDVPVLLVQLMFVLDVADRRYRVCRNLFVAAGVGMVLTGYAGQFHETTDPTRVVVWGLVSTVFYLVLLGVVYAVVFGERGRMPADAERTLRGVWWVVLVSWTLYPLAYAAPLFAPTADGVVGRQVVFTLADITSKVVYGVLLCRIAQIRSAADGYGPAVVDEGERSAPPPPADRQAAAAGTFRDGRPLAV